VWDNKAAYEKKVQKKTASENEYYKNKSETYTQILNTPDKKQE
jgi:hypothetical protein